MSKNKTKRIDIRFDEDQVELMEILKKRFGIGDTPKLVRYALDSLKYTPAPIECPGIKDISKKIARLDKKLDKLRLEEITNRIRSGKAVSKHAKLLTLSFIDLQTKAVRDKWDEKGYVITNGEISKCLDKREQYRCVEAEIYDDWIQNNNVEELEYWSQDQVLEDMGLYELEAGIQEFG